jgi:hypothetical protein
MRRREGFILLYVLFFMTLVLLVGSALAGIIYVNIRSVGDEGLRLKAFYAAEAGLEWAKARIAAAPDWFTDLPHSPVDDRAWILSSSIGHVSQIGDARFKVIREDGKRRIYSVGYVGGDIEGCRALSILKAEFDFSPLTFFKFREL